MALEIELNTYHQRLAELIASNNEGKFALVHGTDVVDVFGAYEDAIKEGYAKFGLEPFLVKQVQAMEQVHFIPRLVACHTSPDKGHRAAT